MNQQNLTVLSNIPLTDTVFEMKLRGDMSVFTAPGQFVNLRLDGFYLRRPISVCDIEGDVLTLVYKVVGHGTEAMSALPAGSVLDTLCGLGNGYDLSKSGSRPLLVGGGVGIPPLYLTAKRLIAEGKEVSAVLGFNTAKEIFYEDRFRALGCNVTVTTADGSSGTKGFVTDALPADRTYFYACGRNRCSKPCTGPRRSPASSASRRGWDAGSARAWAVPAKPSRGPSGSAGKAPYSKRRRSYGKAERHPLWDPAGQSGDPRLRHLRVRV